MPEYSLLAIFTAGTFLMRSAGCVVNDLADQDFDGAVSRTRERPLVVGSVSQRQAIVLLLVLLLLAFGLVLLTHALTVKL